MIPRNVRGGGDWPVRSGVLARYYPGQRHDVRRQTHGPVGRPPASREQAGLVIVAEGLPSRHPHWQGLLLTPETVHRQLRHALALGLRRLRVTAVRGAAENGYCTWPRFGFDAPLPASILAKLPAEHAGARSVLDLIETPAGRLWWRQHGTTLDLVFDLASGSRSWRVFRRCARQPPESAADWPLPADALDHACARPNGRPVDRRTRPERASRKLDPNR